MKLRGRVFQFVLCAFLFALNFPAQAQQPNKISRIGHLAATSARVEAFRQGLRALGYSKGKNIVIEGRYGEGNEQLLPSRSAIDTIFVIPTRYR